MDTVEQLEVYYLFIEALSKSLNNMRAAHKIYSNNEVIDLLPSSSLILISKLERQLDEYLAERNVYQ